MNQEFQELRRQYGVNIQNHIAPIVEGMRENLMERNGGNAEYVIRYTQPGKVVLISTCGIEDLFAVDGDMNPQGL